MKDEADDVRRLRAEVCVFNKKLFDYLEVSNILPILQQKIIPPWMINTWVKPPQGGFIFE